MLTFGRLAWYPYLRRRCPISFTNACVQVLFECWMGRYPFLQPGQELRDLDEEDVRTSSYCNITHAPFVKCSQVLECIDEDNERSVQSLVSSDTRMGEAMKRFLLRCLDRSPNTRPAAIDLMSDPWLTGVDQQVRTPIPSQSTPCSARSFLDLRVYVTFYTHPTCAPTCPSSSLALAPVTLPATDEQFHSKVYSAAEP